MKPQRKFSPKVKELRELARKRRHLVRFCPVANNARAERRIENAIVQGAKRTLKANGRRFTENGIALVRAFARETATEWVGCRPLRYIRRSALPFEAIKKLVGNVK